MVKVTSEYISLGCNRTTHAASWSMDGLVAFGADKLVALYYPLDKHSKGIQETLPGHKNRVICLSFIERGSVMTDMKDIALVSGSADNTAKIWKQNKTGKWINSATIEGHTGAVETIACMRASSIKTEKDLFVTGSSDGTIRIWEREIVDDSTDKVRCLQVINNGNKYPMSLALSYLPDSKVPILASGHTDKLIALYVYQASTNTFEKIHVLQGHDNWVRDLSFATYTGTGDNNINNSYKEGDLMLASGSQDKYIRLWKISPHKTVETVKSKMDQKSTPTSDLLNALKEIYHREGEQLSTKAQHINVEDGAGKRQYSVMFEALLMGHDDWVYSVQWQRPLTVKKSLYAGKYIQPLRLISASSDKSMMIWSPDSNTGVWVNEVRMGDIGGSTYLGFCGALFSPDGKYIVSHGANGSFHLWKDNSTTKGDNNWTPQVAISGHFKSVENLAWDPKSRFLLSTSLDQTTRLYAPWNRKVNHENITTWHEMGRPQVHGYDIKCIAFVHDWQFVSGADEKVLRVFDAPRSCVESLSILTGEENMRTNIENRPIDTNANNEDEDSKAEMGSYAATSVANSLTIMEHPPYEEQLLQHTLWPEVEKLYGHLYEIMCVEVSHDSKYIASTCKAATAEHAVVRLFDTSNWKEIKNGIDAHSLTVTRTRFSHNDRWLLTVSRDRLWSISERVDNKDTPYKLIIKNKAHARIIWDCAWSHDDRFFVTVSRDKTAKIWARLNEKVSDWSCVATIKCTEAVTSVDFAPILLNGRYVFAVGLENGRIQLIQSKDMKVDQWELWHTIDERLCHYGTVKCLAWRQPAAGQHNLLALASAGEDHSVRILNIEY
ncbi:WD40-repeat-containing domain protein [Pilobolus umbonatus]|nr:WD40-repeat-containing domain protein [Pilobolus umbonatus]